MHASTPATSMNARRVHNHAQTRAFGSAGR
jgi:hypothetical protein